jgi:hypothetical protein
MLAASREMEPLAFSFAYYTGCLWMNEYFMASADEHSV